MADVGIIGSGIAGLHLGLSLLERGIPATIYTEWTPDQQLARRLPNMVARNAITRARERRLSVNHWDRPSHDMGWLAVRVAGPTPLSFSGSMTPSQAVDMRIYGARLLDDFSSRGGQVVIGAIQTFELERLATRHRLLVVASGRANLSSLFPRVEEHSPFTSPQRLAVGGLFRGVRYSEPRALEVNVSPGNGEILVVPFQSFEPDLTGMGILITAGGASSRSATCASSRIPPRSPGRCSACCAITPPRCSNGSIRPYSAFRARSISATPPSRRRCGAASSRCRTAAPRLRSAMRT